ncbi:hypothetical protein LSTR_LSTR006795 [Laodelphax striatellus]|uniref:PiggyBac transposable element-derived protein domain-containing protein n=1 Tax=Laodelphax striatellus TaxID=195883 RepID=A0A482WTF4_LAOST|nr:hypothetical protein LSTR_LSTR006795 [Laodelphax striatellus]
MGGVDSSDKSIYHVSCSRPTKKYWKNFFMNFLDIALLNAYLLYKKNTDKPVNRHKFIVQVIEELANSNENNDEVREQVQQLGQPHELTHLPGRQERLCGVRANKKKG